MKPNDPTPEQIEAACLLIQAGWSPEERMRRLRADLRPTYQRGDGERLEMSSDVYDRHHRARQELQEMG